jgi:hypothetical protein
VVRYGHPGGVLRVRETRQRVATALTRFVSGMLNPAGWKATVGYKLSVGVGVVALLGIFAAGVGYYSIARISTSVGLVADTSSPLLTESLRLLGDAIRVRAAVLGRVRGISSSADAMAAIENLHSTAQSRFGSMRTRAKAAGIEDVLDEIQHGEIT